MEERVKGVVSLAMLIILVSTTVGTFWQNRHWLRSLAGNLIGLRCLRKTNPNEEEAAFEQRVAERRSEMRIQRARAALPVLVVACIPLEAVHLSNVFAGMSHATIGGVMCRQALIFCLVCVTLLRDQLTATLLDAVYFGVTVLQAASAVLSGDLRSEGLVYAWLATFAICLFDLKVWVNLIGIIVSAAAAGVAVRADPNMFRAVPAQYAFMFLLAVWLDHVHAASARLEVAALDSSNEMSALKRLLGTICDVVIELDSRLCMTQHSERLADILMHGSGRSLKGKTIQEFMPEEEDREKFTNLLASADKASSQADVFHARLCDSQKLSISMEFFSLVFVGPDSCRRHMLGMREYTDIQPIVPLKGSSQQPSQQPMADLLVEHDCGEVHRGTPAHAHAAEQHPAPRPPSSRASSPSSTRRSSSPKAPLRKETTELAKRLSLAALLTTWHAERRASSCCLWHSMLADLQRITAELLASHCDPSFRPIYKWQCRRCGTLDEQHRESSSGSCRMCKGVRRASLSLNSNGSASQRRESL